MKNINISELGLKEMSELETKETNGGILPLIIVGVVVVGVAAGYGLSKWWSHR